MADPERASRPMFRETSCVLAPPGTPSLQALIVAGGLRIVVLRAGCACRQRLEALRTRRGGVGLGAAGSRRAAP